MPYDANGQDLKELGVRLRELREGANLTQRELSGALGCTGGYISLIENGERNPTLDVIERIAAVTGHEVDLDIRPAGQMSRADRSFIRSLMKYASQITDPTERLVLLSQAQGAVTRCGINKRQS